MKYWWCLANGLLDHSAKYGDRALQAVGELDSGPSMVQDGGGITIGFLKFDFFLGGGGAIMCIGRRLGSLRSVEKGALPSASLHCAIITADRTRCFTHTTFNAIPSALLSTNRSLDRRTGGLLCA